MNLKSNKVNVIGILPGGVVTEKLTAEIELDENGEFVTSSPDGVVGKFYASTGILDQLAKAIDNVLHGRLVEN